MIGDTVNLTSRLQGLAQRDDIIVTKSTADLIPGFKNLFVREYMEPVRVKGKAEPIEILRVTGRSVQKTEEGARTAAVRRLALLWVKVDPKLAADSSFGRSDMKTQALFILAAVALAACLAAQAQQVVTVTGTAAILNKDTAQARDRAIESALRAAVEQVIGTMLDSESLVKDNELLSTRSTRRPKATSPATTS